MRDPQPLQMVGKAKHSAVLSDNNPYAGVSAAIIGMKLWKQGGPKGGSQTKY